VFNFNTTQQCKQFRYTVNSDTGRLLCADSMTEILWLDSKQEQEIFNGCPKCQTDFGHSQFPISSVPWALSQMLGQGAGH